MPDTAAGALFGAYRLIGIAAIPAVPLILARRAARGKEDRARLGERYGRASLPRPDGQLVWVHAASVGETNAVLPLIRRIVEEGVSVVQTSVTVTSARIAATALPKGAVHQFVPVDIAPFVGRFLTHWRPDAALFVESELWPATMMQLGAFGVPQVLVNARLSERSFRGWQRFGRGARALFSRIDLCLAQSAGDGERYAGLGARAVEVTGNLKFDAPPLAADLDEVAAFRLSIGKRPVWIAASTHEGEEEIAASAHRLLRVRYSDLLTLIAPRHPVRGEAIAATLAGQGFAVARRSAGEPLTPATEIYVADTLGELGLFYRLAPIAFLGGSLVPRGGQNPIEPTRLGTAVLHGPLVENFREIYATLDDATGTRPIEGPDTLAGALDRLTASPALRERQAAEAAAALASYSGALDRTMKALRPYLLSERERAVAPP
jgi:3-deoxy-D-manno-octulosonic-acid transferase